MPGKIAHVGINDANEVVINFDPDKPSVWHAVFTAEEARQMAGKLNKFAGQIEGIQRGDWKSDHADVDERDRVAALEAVVAWIGEEVDTILDGWPPSALTEDDRALLRKLHDEIEKAPSLERARLVRRAILAGVAARKDSREAMQTERVWIEFDDAFDALIDHDEKGE